MVAAASVVDLSSEEVTSATYSVEVTTVAVGAVAGTFSSAVAALALSSSVSGSVEVTSGVKPELEVTGPSSVLSSDSGLGGGGGDLKQKQTCLIQIDFKLKLASIIYQITFKIRISGCTSNPKFSIGH